MTPGIEKGPATANKETKINEEEASLERVEFEGLDSLDGPTNEISKEEAQKRGMKAVKAFIDKNIEHADDKSNFSLDVYGPEYNADEHPEVCNTLARKQTKLKALESKFTDVQEELENAEAGTVKQKVCAYKEAAFKIKINQLQNQVDELQEKIRDSDITLTK